MPRLIRVRYLNPLRNNFVNKRTSKKIKCAINLICKGNKNHTPAKGRHWEKLRQNVFITLPSIRTTAHLPEKLYLPFSWIIIKYKFYIIYFFLCFLESVVWFPSPTFPFAHGPPEISRPGNREPRLDYACCVIAWFYRQTWSYRIKMGKNCQRNIHFQGLNTGLGLAMRLWLRPSRAQHLIKMPQSDLHILIKFALCPGKSSKKLKLKRTLSQEPRTEKSATRSPKRKH